MIKTSFLLLKKEWLNLFHDRWIFVIVFAVPLFCAALFTALYSEQDIRHIPAAIVDLDNSDNSRMVVEQLEASENLAIQAYYNSFEELENAVQSGEIITGVVIPKDFGKNIELRRATRLLMVVDGTNMIYATNSGTTLMEIAETLRATVGVKTLLAYRPTDDDDLYSSVSGLTDGEDVTIKDILADDDDSESSSSSSTGDLELDMDLYDAGYTMADALKVYMPINFEDEAWFNPTKNYAYFILLGLFLNVWQQCMALFCSTSIMGDTGSPFWVHLKTSGISKLRLFVTKSLMQLAVVIGTGTLILKISFDYIKLPTSVSFGTWLVFITCFALALHGLGAMMSTYLGNSVDATRMSMIIALPSFMLSGFSWPLEEMIVPLQKVVQILPQTWFFQGINYLSFKSPTPAFTEHYCLVLLTMAVIFYGITAIGLTLKERV